MPVERLILYRSNRLEALLDCLVTGLRQDPPPPLTGECVVVQSRGMATWLGHRLARRFGVWAHPDFPHPRRFIERLLRAALGPAADSAASFNREVLTLAILEMLPHLAAQEEFVPLRRYLEKADDGQSLQLAERIAYIFDQYLVYRPELVLAWEDAGEASAAGPLEEAAAQRAGISAAQWAENRWQAPLWRQLAARLGASSHIGHGESLELTRHGSPARLFRQALARLQEGRLAAPELLPARVFLFGITTLPPLYLALLNEAARLIPCHLLLFTPAREYWADIFSPRDTSRLLLRQQRRQSDSAGSEDMSPEAPPLETLSPEESPSEELPPEESPPEALPPEALPSEALHDLHDLLHLETGHPLLASLGDVGREIQEIMEEQVEYHQPPGGECFVAPLAPVAVADDPTTATATAAISTLAGDPAQITLLARLQQDILELRQPGPPNFAAPTPVAKNNDLAGDHSLVVHACHSPLREVEVLQDQLLAMLDQEGYRPRDIVVMVPDIETYAPLIEAVFRRPAGDSRHIPFRIADRRLSREAPLLDALLTLFELAAGRLPLSRVLDFLGREPVRQGFSLDDRQLRRLAQWLEQGRVRWGIDEEHRRRHDQPADRQNTWRFGLDRLLLGYALPGEERHLRTGILPLADIEGQDAQLAGVLLKFTASLFALADRVRRPQPPAGWVELVRQTLADFFLPEERAAAGEEWQWQSLRDALAALLQESDQAGLARPLELSAFLRLLRARLDEAGGSAGFLEGGLTFCNMLPMRTIPFPVVCLLGLNDGAFPRQDHPAGFDLLAAAPKPGDRSRRRDDRYLFLESLLSARQRFYLSYVGRSSKDNAELPPSPVVDELLDCLQPMTGADRSSLVVEHPLQPFSPRYFHSEAASLFTYAAEYAPTAGADVHSVGRAGEGHETGLAGRAGESHESGSAGCAGDDRETGSAAMVPGAGSPAAPARPVAPQSRPGGPLCGEAATVELTLADLQRFFRNPARWYARHRLGLVLPPPAAERPDREPVFWDNLEKYRLNRQLLSTPAALPTIAAGDEAGRRLGRLLAARGELPLAGAAGPALAELVAEIEPVAACLAGQPAGPARPNLPLELLLEPEPGFTLHLAGELRDRARDGLLRWTAGRATPLFLLQAWLDHLVLCALAPGDQELRCLMVGRGEKKDGVARADIRLFAPLDRPLALTLLASLAALWRRGQAEPLPFFPLSSQAWCRKMQTGKSDDPARLGRQAREAALAAYHGDDFNRGEGLDPYLAMIFQEAQPAGQWREQSGGEFGGPGGAAWEDFVAVAETVYGPMLQALAKAPEEGK